MFVIKGIFVGYFGDKSIYNIQSNCQNLISFPCFVFYFIDSDEMGGNWLPAHLIAIFVGDSNLCLH